MSSSPKTSQKPNDADVLFGRGNFAKFHPGNFRFRKLVGEFRSAWRATKSRKDRSNIAKKIIHEIENGHPPGKFVKFDMHTRVWQEVTFEQALIKTQKALREYVTTEEYAPDEEQRRGFDEGEQRSLEGGYRHNTTVIRNSMDTAHRQEYVNHLHEAAVQFDSHPYNNPHAHHMNLPLEEGTRGEVFQHHLKTNSRLLASQNLAQQNRVDPLPFQNKMDKHSRQQVAMRHGQATSHPFQSHNARRSASEYNFAAQQSEQVLLTGASSSSTMKTNRMDEVGHFPLYQTSPARYKSGETEPHGIPEKAQVGYKRIRAPSYLFIDNHSRSFDLDETPPRGHGLAHCHHHPFYNSKAAGDKKLSSLQLDEVLRREGTGHDIFSHQFDTPHPQKQGINLSHKAGDSDFFCEREHGYAKRGRN